MASDRAISALSLALRGLLLDARPQDGELKDAAVELFQATGFKKGLPLGVSIFLYRSTVSTARRTLPSRTGPDGKKLRPALPLDLYYMFTPWAATAESQHLLLAWMMRVLEDTPILSARFLNSFDPEHEPFGADETVDLVFEPTTIQDMLNIWEVQKHDFQVSANYVARVVPIDSRVPLPEAGPLVQTRI